MNVLITSIGQRGYLVDHFKENNPEVGVFAADATGYAPGLQNADKGFIIPLAKSPTYFDELLKICKENNIDAIISINDLELPILAKYKKQLEENGIKAIVSEPDVVDVCFDKYLTYLFCKENGIGVPKTFLYTEKDVLLEAIANNEITYPIIAKPRKGSRSVGIHLVENEKQLLEDIELMHEKDVPEDEKLIFQEYIDSDQYSVHVFNDKNNVPVKVVGMINIFKHFGETFHIKTSREEGLLALGKNIGEKLRHLGPLSADVHRRSDGEFVVLEFNPRLSGCYSLSHFAGADFTGKIIQVAKNEPIADDIFGYEDTIMLKQFTTAKVSAEDIVKK